MNQMLSLLHVVNVLLFSQVGIAYVCISIMPTLLTNFLFHYHAPIVFHQNPSSASHHTNTFCIGSESTYTDSEKN